MERGHAAGLASPRWRGPNLLVFAQRSHRERHHPQRRRQILQNAVRAADQQHREGWRREPPPRGSRSASRGVVRDEEEVAPRRVGVVSQVRQENGVHVTARFIRFASKLEASSFGEAITLTVVARHACRDQVLPGPRIATAALRHDVINRQRDAGSTAVLAGMTVARKDLFAAQLGARSWSANTVA